MSTIHIGAALDEPADLTPVERLLLVLIARDAEEDGAVFTSAVHLARSANITPRTATRSLHRLHEAGLLQRARGIGEAGAWAWRLTLPAPAGAEEPQA
ncbi:helix-turn-helix domain-containing protein [Streptomyces sp. NPDC006367]|uniref:helix-turn-helix domain-containing protein n=1 Tax=unclassified Streptomyces TaxID=2593676 RepID=UPI0033AC00C6